MPTTNRRLRTPEPNGKASPVSTPTVTKRDHVAAEVRRMINEGELPRGSRVQQDLLATMFNTSITPVREALRLLEAEGILVGAPYRGVRVADADYEKVKAVYLMRRLVEPYAMRRAARRLSARDVDIAEGLEKDMVKAASVGDRALFNATNHRFHFLLFARCGNSSLIDEIALLWQQYPWDILQVLGDRVENSTNEHEEMLLAARLGDGDALARATERHLTRSFLALAEHLTGQEVPDPFEIDND